MSRPIGPGQGPHDVADGPWVHIHYRRLPDRLDIYRQRLIEVRPHVHVTYQEHTPLPAPVRVGDRVILEPGSPVVWFTFPGRWHDIGRFHDARGQFTGIYSNILTPCVMHPPTPIGHTSPDSVQKGGAGTGATEDGAIRWDTTDLMLDVWMGPDGVPRLLDEDDFQAARLAGILDPEMANAARREADRILKAIPSGQWPPPVVHEWTLERVLSFGT